MSICVFVTVIALGTDLAAEVFNVFGFHFDNSVITAFCSLYFKKLVTVKGVSLYADDFLRGQYTGNSSYSFGSIRDTSISE